MLGIDPASLLRFESQSSSGRTRFTHFHLQVNSSALLPPDHFIKCTFPKLCNLLSRITSDQIFFPFPPKKQFLNQFQLSLVVVLPLSSVFASNTVLFHPPMNTGSFWYFQGHIKSFDPERKASQETRSCALRARCLVKALLSTSVVLLLGQI